MTWRKSTFSSTDISCMEVNAVWRKSTRSGPWTDNCVEVNTADPSHGESLADRLVLIRESEDPDVVVITTVDKWRAFVEGVKAGEFDL